MVLCGNKTTLRYEEKIHAIDLLAFALGFDEQLQEGQNRLEREFRMNGAKFGTLQEVFNAIGDGQTADIKLLKDAEGDGAVLPEGKNTVIFLDFGEFCYELNEGKPIDLDDSEATLSANGGAVKGSSSFIKSKGGSLSFEGDLDLEVNIETASETDFGESFTGSFKGNLTVDGCEVYFACPEATVDIHQLTVKGENACVQVIEAPQGGMKIEKVISTLPHPVCAMEPNAATIGEGAQLHVHNFIQSEKEATCCTLKEIVHTCSECGFSYEDADVEGGYEPCPIEDLVHYDEVPQGDTSLATQSIGCARIAAKSMTMRTAATRFQVIICFCPITWKPAILSFMILPTWKCKASLIVIHFPS